MAAKISAPLLIRSPWPVALEGALRYIVGFCATNSGGVEVYVPSDDFGRLVERELQQLGTAAKFIERRSAPRYSDGAGGVDGNRRKCDRHNEASALYRLGLSVKANACKGCPFAPDCRQDGFDAQFYTGARVHIRTSFYLPFHDDRLGDPVLVVVLGEFVTRLADRREIDLRRHASRLMSAPVRHETKNLAKILAARPSGDTPLLRYLDCHGISSRILGEASAKLARQLCGLDVSELPQRGPAWAAMATFRDVFGALAEEMSSFPHRPTSHVLRALSDDPTAPRVAEFTFRRTLAAEVAGARVVVVDPLGNTALISRALGPGLEVIDIHVRENELARALELIQVSDTTGTNRQLNTSKWVDELIGLLPDGLLARTLILCAEGNVLARVRTRAAQLGITEARVGLLGDRLISCETDLLVILGRTMPSIREIEQQARCLYWDNQAPVVPLPPGEMPTATRALVLRDGRTVAVEAPVHPDSRVQELLEYRREHALLRQVELGAYGRERRLTVLLFCNLPLPDLPADQLYSRAAIFDRLRLLKLMAREPVIPLRAAWLEERYPYIFPRGASGFVKRMAKQWKSRQTSQTTAPLLNLGNLSELFRGVRYQVEGAAGAPSHAVARIGVAPSVIQALVEHHLGCGIKKLSIMEPGQTDQVLAAPSGRNACDEVGGDDD